MCHLIKPRDEFLPFARNTSKNLRNKYSQKTS